MQHLLKYIDVCSGISAPTMGWKHMGWEALCYAEIDQAPRAVLKHHYPDTPLHGDFTAIKGDEHGPADLIVGGTPCQSFSLAGLRKGMDDDRGNLALEYIRLARRARTRWVVWENVPGVFTSSGGEDFRCFLSGLAGWDVPLPAGGWQNSGIIQSAPGDLTWGLAWRVLDAQHFGVPQRRRRVFVVGYLGDWRRAAAVLFERHCLQGHSAPRRQKGQVAPTRPSRRSAGGGLGTDFDCDGGLIPRPMIHRMQAMGKYESDEIAGSLKARDYKDATDLITHCFDAGQSDVCQYGDQTGTLGTDCGNAQAVRFSSKDYGADAGNLAPTLRAGGHAESHANAGAPPAIAVAASVRRLVPRECERLQGFPDDFTLVPWRKKMMPDGPRYKMLGNSMAVPVLRWLGERVQAVEALAAELELAA